MTSPAVLALDEWQIRFHETMAALLRAQEAVKQRFGLFGLVTGLWRCSRDLRALNDSLKAISDLPDGVLDQEFIQSQIPQLHKLLGSIESLLETAKLKGLTNRSLTAGPLGSIAIRGDYVADYLDALAMSIDPEVLAAISEGRGQIERGEFEVMERLF